MGVQKSKAQADDVADRFEVLGGMKGHFRFAEKKGYSGVGLYARKKPSAVLTGIGNAEFDAEGAGWRRASTPRGASSRS